MTFEEVWKIAAAILVSLGGAGSVVLGLSNYFGKVWADRLMEADRAKHNSVLEQLKTQYAKDLEDYRARASISIAQIERYNIRQFEIYGSLWAALYDLKLVADKLWEEATKETLLEFTNQRQTTAGIIHKGSLFLKEEDYDRLKELLKDFGSFLIGKTKLINIRSDNEFNHVYIPGQADQQILENRQYKDQYDNLIEKIRSSFVAHLSESELRQ